MQEAVIGHIGWRIIMVDKVHFSSKKQDWQTPQDFFNTLNDEFFFTLDVCANKDNHMLDNYLTEEEDGLTYDWGKNICWMNPPYGREISKWLRKAHSAALYGATVVCLIPARTDTKYWHNYVMKADEVRLVKGRLKFQGAEHPAPFPSAVIVFRPFPTESYPTFSTIENK